MLPHGVLFRGGEEGQIRRNLVENDKIDAIIGLPANIFFGTGIPTIVMVLKKNRDNSDILVIDASKNFVKEGKNNKLRASDIRRIVDAYEARENVERFCRSVPKQEVRDNDYNLNIPRYVDSSEATETWDIYATMFGGIPTREIDALASYWDAFPGLCKELFENVSEVSMRLKADDVADVIRACTSVREYVDKYSDRFDGFGMWLFDELVDETSLVLRDREESIIASEVFCRLDGIPLVDRYDAYQLLDDVWQQIAIDLEIIQTEGFDAVRCVDPNMVIKKKKGKDVETQDGWIGRVMPFDLVQHEVLSDEVAEISAFERRLSAIASEVAEILDELTEDEKQEAADALNDNNDAFVASKIKGVAKTLKADMGAEANEPDSLPSKLERAAALFDEEKAVKKKLKEAKTKLENRTKEVIESLTDEQASALLDAKWNKPLVKQLQTLPGTVIDELVAKVCVLRDKYATTYADIDAEIQSVEAELVGMLGALTGNEFDMAGINELAKLLGGELR